MFSFTLRAGSNRRVQKRVAAAADIDRLIRMTDRQRADYIGCISGAIERSAPVSHADQFGIRRGLRHRMIVDAIKRERPCA